MARPQVLVLNLATDADDPVLGFTTSWVDALARHSAHVDVITMRAGRLDLPSNVAVHSVGKEQGFSEPRRLVEFYRALGQVLSARRIDVCFAHMAPLFAVLASPVLVPRQIPIVTWFAHPRLSLTLRLAHWASTAMVTSLPSAYPHRSHKLHVVGQGIDTEVFKPGCGTLDKRLILCVGRLSRVKDHPTLLRAVSILQREAPGSFEVNVVGGTARPEDAPYSSELMAEAQRADLEGIVKFIGPVARAELPAWYCRAAVHVNLTPLGFGDKVALEAMSCATPCLTANADLQATLGVHAETLLFAAGNADELAAKLHRVLTMPEGTRLAMGRDLREQVVARHGLDRLARRILDIGLAGRDDASGAASN